jgi:putative tryptophan/tyrosine transport system substrate-binding protein
MMQRRAFITLLGGTVIAWPLAARAQQPGKAARIGYLAIRAPMSADEALLQALRELNWIEGRNIVIERRFSAGNFDRLREFAAELVRLKVDAIVAVASASTQAAKDATASIPICFVNAGDPVGQGFAMSLARPGGNVTGVSFDASPDITAKQLQLILETVPKASRVAVLWNPTSPFLRSYWSVAQAAAPALGVVLQSLEVQDASQYETAFKAIGRDRADALVVLSDSFATFHRARIAELAAEHRLPVLYGHRQYVEAGGLMSYGPSLFDVYRRAAAYVDKILKGTRPADLPVEQPTKYELVINLKTAKALGLELPPTLLARADEVIE